MSSRFVASLSVAALTAFACAKGEETKTASSAAAQTTAAGHDAAVTTTPDASVLTLPDGVAATTAAVDGATTLPDGETTTTVPGQTTMPGQTTVAGTGEQTTAATTTMQLPPQAFQIVGTLAIGNGIGDLSADGFNAGDRLTNPTVFLQGHPDILASVDNQGAFTLAISPTGYDAADYTLMAWYVGATTHVKVGVGIPLHIAPGDTVNINDLPAYTGNGDVPLGYTIKAGFDVKDAADHTTSLTPGHGDSCVVTIRGLEGLLTTSYEAGPHWCVDYIPPGSYKYSIKCQGYKATPDADLVVTAAGSAGNWRATPGVPEAEHE
jgi:hypothetical protein